MTLRSLTLIFAFLAAVGVASSGYLFFEYRGATNSWTQERKSLSRDIADRSQRENVLKAEVTDLQRAQQGQAPTGSDTALVDMAPAAAPAELVNERDGLVLQIESAQRELDATERRLDTQNEKLQGQGRLLRDLMEQLEISRADLAESEARRSEFGQADASAESNETKDAKDRLARINQQITERRRELARRENHLEEINTDVDSALEQRQVTLAEIETTNAVERAARKTLDALLDQVAEQKSEFGLISDSVDKLRAEEISANQARETAGLALTETETKSDQQTKDLASLAATIGDRRETLQKVTVDLTAAKQEVERLGKSIATAETTQATVTSEGETLGQRVAALAQESKSLGQQNTATKAALAEGQIHLEQLTTQNTAAAAELAEATAAKAAAKTAIAAAELALEQRQTAIAEAKQTLEVTAKAEADAETRKNDILTEVSRVTAQLAERQVALETTTAELSKRADAVKAAEIKLADSNDQIAALTAGRTAIDQESTQIRGTIDSLEEQRQALAKRVALQRNTVTKIENERTAAETVLNEASLALKKRTGEQDAQQAAWLQAETEQTDKIEKAKSQIAALTADRQALDGAVAAISQERAAGEQGLKELNATIEARKSAVAKLSDSFARRQAEIQSAEENQNRANQQLAALTDKLTKRDTDVTKLTQEIESKSATLNLTNERLAAGKIELTELAEKSAASRTAFADLQARHGDLKADLATFANDLQSKQQVMAALDQSLAAKRQTLSEVESKASAKAKTASNAEYRLIAAITANKEAEKKQGALRAELESVTDTIASKQQAMAALNQSLAAKRATLAKVATIADANAQTASNAEDRLTAAIAANKEAEQKHDTLRADLKSVTDTIASKRQAMAALNQSLAAKRATLAKVASKADDYGEIVADTEKRLVAAETAANAAEQRKDALRTDLKTATGDIASKQQALLALDTKIGAKAADFDALAGNLESTLAELASTEKRLEESRAAIGSLQAERLTVTKTAASQNQFIEQTKRALADLSDLLAAQKFALAEIQSDLATTNGEHEKRTAELAVLNKAIATQQARQAELTQNFAADQTTQSSGQAVKKPAPAPAKPIADGRALESTSTALGLVKIEPAAKQPINRATLAQIGSFRSIARAERQWKDMSGANADLFDDLERHIERVDLGADKGIWYRLMVAALPTVDEARRFCAELNSRSGQTACFLARR